MRFEIYSRRSGVRLRKQWYWRLRAKNGRIVAHGGEGYLNRADCLHAIDLIRQEAVSAPIKERDGG